MTIAAPDRPKEVDEYLDEFLGQRPMTVWEKLLSTSTHAKRAREDVEQVIRAIHGVAKPEDDPVFFTGTSLHSARLEPDS